MRTSPTPPQPDPSPREQSLADTITRLKADGWQRTTGAKIAEMRAARTYDDHEFTSVKTRDRRDPDGLLLDTFFEIWARPKDRPAPTSTKAADSRSGRQP